MDERSLSRLNRLAGDIIGDLRGILSNIQNEGNIRQPHRKILEDVLASALRTADLGILALKWIGRFRVGDIHYGFYFLPVS